MLSGKLAVLQLDDRYLDAPVRRLDIEDLADVLVDRVGFPTASHRACGARRRHAAWSRRSGGSRRRDSRWQPPSARPRRPGWSGLKRPEKADGPFRSTRARWLGDGNCG